MTIQDWSSKGVADRQKFGQARHQLHSLVQWLARTERSYGPANSSDAGIVLQWCPSRQAITTSRFERGLQLELRLPEMILQFREEGEAVKHALHAEEHSPAQVEAWLLIELLHRGVDRTKFSKELPYDVSGLMSGDGEEFSPEGYQLELEALTGWLSRAAAEISRASGSDFHGRDCKVVLRPEDLSLEIAAGADRVLGFKTSGTKLEELFFYVRTGDSAVQAGEHRELILPASQLPSNGGVDRIRTFFQAS